MKTYYITFEKQGNAEICIAVEANDEDEAYEKAFSTFINTQYDTYADTEMPEDVLVVDEEGCEL